MEYNLTHIKDFEEQSNGPVQSDEALFLYALVKVIKPRVIVEFGFSKGHSAINFINAMADDCRLYSFDNGIEAEKRARLINDKRFKFILKNQTDFETSDIGSQKIDLLFIDASHNLELNILTFRAIEKELNSFCVIVIHDTGSWNITHKNDPFNSGEFQGYFINDTEYIHQPDERLFVNFIKNNYSQYEQVHLHTLNTFRHGMTLFQKRNMLSLGKTTFLDSLDQWLRTRDLKMKSSLVWFCRRCIAHLKARRLPDVRAILKNRKMKEIDHV